MGSQGVMDLSIMSYGSTAPLLKVKALKACVVLPTLAIGVLALLITPTVWAAIPVLMSTQADILVAGPTQTDSFDGNFGGRRDENASTNSALLRYLEARQGTAKFLVAVSSSNQADSIILATNKPVMTLGGFSGSDPILTTNQLAALVKSGKGRYFLLDGWGGGGLGGSSQSALATWTKQHSKIVPASQWQSTSTSRGFSGAAQLYEYTEAP